MNIEIDIKPAFTIYHYDGIYENDERAYEFSIIDSDDSLEIEWADNTPPNLKKVEKEILKIHKKQVL